MASPDSVNPYQPPATGQPTAVQVQTEFRPRPCPECRSTNIDPTPYSAWRGRRAPEAIKDVTCRDCNCNYDGQTGVKYPPAKNPLIWFLLALVAALAYFGFIVYAFVAALSRI